MKCFQSMLMAGVLSGVLGASVGIVMYEKKVMRHCDKMGVVLLRTTPYECGRAVKNG